MSSMPQSPQPNQMTKELQAVLAAALTVPAESLPDFLAEIEKIRVTAWARLMRPTNEHVRDELVDVGEAAIRLGMSQSYLYHHEFPFTRRIGRSVRFSARGIQQFIECGRVSSRNERARLR
jgi:predicted DNA-binding transcriptional regulator AlpA